MKTEVLKKGIHSARWALIGAVVLFLLSLGINSFSFLARVRFSTGNFLNEVLVIGFIGLSIYAVLRFTGWDSMSITKRLRIALLMVVAIYVVGIGITTAAKPEFIAPRFGSSYVVRPNSISGVLVSNMIAVVALTALVICLRILQSLIFYRRKKNTARHFSLLLIVGSLTAISAAFSGKPLKYDGSANHTVTFILLILTTAMMSINLFRVGWITALNRRQKFFTFLGGLIFSIVSAGLLGAEVGGGLTYSDITYSYSVTAGAFLFMTTMFIFLYSLSTTVNALLHLPTAAIYDKKVREINSIMTLSSAINSLFDFNKIVTTVTELTSEAISAPACWLELANQKNPAFRAHFDFTSLKMQTGFHIHFLDLSSRKFIAKESNIPTNDLDHRNYIFEPTEWIIAHKQPLLLNQVKRDKMTKDLLRTPIESLVGVPLISSQELTGIIWAVKSTPFGFDQDDVAIISALANQTAVAIENARLVKESLEKERLQEELRIAHDVQMKLIPQTIPDIKSEITRLRLDIGATTIPANEVGGDYFDFVKLSEWRVGIVVADVSGKGTSAAFYMAEIKGIIQALAGIYPSPEDLLTAVNDVLYGTIDRKTFITLLYADIDISKNELRFARAGHCPMLRIHGGEKTFIASGGIGLGLDKGPIFKKSIEEKIMPIEAGDVFVMHSDGLVEARNEHGEEFGEARLCQALDHITGMSAEEIKTRIISAVRKFVGPAKAHDDLTCVVFKTDDIHKTHALSAPTGIEPIPLGENLNLK